MIIVAYKPGQLANRLILFANLYAYALEDNFKIYNPSFYNYSKYFDYNGVASSAIINQMRYLKDYVFFKFFNIISRLFIKLHLTDFLLCKIIHLNYDEKLLLEKGNWDFKNKLVFIHGWGFRSYGVKTKRTEILQYFTLKKSYVQQIDEFIKNNNLSSDVIVVHIRRGDYISFEGGKFYYSDDQYISILSKVLKNETNCTIVICSNELINLEKFSKALNKRVISGPGTEITDLYFMAKSRLIIGPPSTYSIWASFVGNVPLLTIQDPNNSLDYNDAKIYTNFN
jgi:hypothetical protein